MDWRLYEGWIGGAEGSEREWDRKGEIRHKRRSLLSLPLLGFHRLPLFLLLSSLSLTLLSLSWLHARLEIVRGGNSDQRRDDKKPLTRRGIRHEKGRRRWRHLEQRERRQYWTELDNDICNRKSVKLWNGKNGIRPQNMAIAITDHHRQNQKRHFHDLTSDRAKNREECFEAIGLFCS